MAKQSSKQDSAAAAAAGSQGGLGGQPSGGLASYGSSPTAMSDGKVRLAHPVCMLKVDTPDRDQPSIPSQSPIAPPRSMRDRRMLG